ncbi:MAG: YkgJ family cysteine cluster protein [Cytophagaceae bacterium]
MDHYSDERFLEMIRKVKSSELDVISQPIVEKVYQSYDCASCGRCCSVLNPPFTPDDAAKVADKISMKVEEFETKYLADVGSEHMKVMNCTPCAFLQGTLCKVYESRPDSCADYPHLHHKGIKYRIRSVLKNKSVCPMVEEWIMIIYNQLL